jgi:arylsulfatase A-like enzyme
VNPYDPPEEMADLYYDASIPEPIGSSEELKGKPSVQRNRGKSSLNNSMYRIDLSQATPEHYRRWRAHYYANITLIDEGIGKMLDALEAAGTLDDTLIIFTSDHGDALGDHGLPYKGFFYDSMVHVPLIMRGPGVPSDQRCSALVSTIDLVPLFYRACGIAPPETLQGEDISTLLNDPASTIRSTAFSEIQGRAMVLTEQYKYAHYADGSAELYELQTDAHEVRNLAGKKECQEVENQLRGMLLKHWLSNQSQQSRAVSQPQYRVRRKLEEQYKKHLKAGGKPENALAPSF